VERICETAGIHGDAVLPDDTTVICIDRRWTRAARPAREGPRGGNFPPPPATLTSAVPDVEDEHHAA
jgi:hypothetical protein